VDVSWRGVALDPLPSPAALVSLVSANQGYDTAEEAEHGSHRGSAEPVHQ
jgi:hypothetical protein